MDSSENQRQQYHHHHHHHRQHQQQQQQNCFRHLSSQRYSTTQLVPGPGEGLNLLYTKPMYDDTWAWSFRDASMKKGQTQTCCGKRCV